MIDINNIKFFPSYGILAQKGDIALTIVGYNNFINIRENRPANNEEVKAEFSLDIHEAGKYIRKRARFARLSIIL